MTGENTPAGDTTAARPANRRSLRRWAAWTALAAVVVSVGAIAGGGYALIRLQRARTTVIDHLDPAIRAGLILSNALVNEETGVRGYILSAQEDFLTPYTSGRTSEQDATRDLRTAVEGRFPQVIADLDATAAAARAWQSQYAEPVLAMVQQTRTPTTTADVDRGKQLFDEVRRSLTALRTHLDGLQAQARRDLARAATVLQWTSVDIALALVLGVLWLAVALNRNVLRPVTLLTRSVRRVAAGDLTYRVPADGPAEIESLAADVESMRQRIMVELSALQSAHASLEAQAHELERSNSELEQFAYVASHDLQEPLRKVASFCELLENRYGDLLDERGKQYVAFAVDGATRMQVLINDLLAFSRVGRMSNGHNDVDLNRVLHSARNNLGAAIEDADAEIDADDLPTVKGDMVLLTTVLQNLIGNAVKFRQADVPPRIEIRVRPDGPEWLFTVTDNGIGVDPGYAERIFIIFQRLHAKSAYPGTGIGLAMVRKIVEYHGGRIWLDTEPRPDGEHGSRFAFTLPRAADEEPGTTEQPALPEQPGAADKSGSTEEISEKELR
ncbi:sensor histidine kinase [Hamadaea tsunoensis]|uniref:sensor histidine kinase n=1 Tax=Hamadaea tsunoensis TaxID=53368 RepID=UPI000402AE5E|nr:sensor histidine kinase [Hamadaea tsunoensis]